jgi:hypothetical protein
MIDKERLMSLGNALDESGVSLHLLDNKMFQILVIRYMKKDISLENVVELSKKIEQFQNTSKKVFNTKGNHG